MGSEVKQRGKKAGGRPSAMFQCLQQEWISDILLSEMFLKEMVTLSIFSFLLQILGHINSFTS